MHRLPPPQREIVRELVDELAGIPRLAAVVLGGSHARGRATPASDVDLGLLYDEAAPFAIDAVRAVAARVNDSPAPVVSDFYEWGPWVNGGAWLRVRGHRVDLLYRSFEHVDRVWRDAQRGEYALHAEQQPPFGFFGPTVLGEISICSPLHDPDRRVAALKARVAEYPEPLREAVVQRMLWSVEFGLGFARKFADRGDPYGVSGCLSRFAHRLALVLFALNRLLPLNDKTLLDEIDAFAVAPERFSGRVRTVLAHPGATASEFAAAVDSFEALLLETKALAGALYRPPYAPPG